MVNDIKPVLIKYADDITVSVPILKLSHAQVKLTQHNKKFAASNPGQTITR